MVVPVGQAVQLVPPFVSWYVPVSQIWHVLNAVAPTASENLPIGQSEQELCVALLYLPASQSKHAVLAAFGYLPASHESHVDDEVAPTVTENLPLEQSEQELCVA